MDEGDNNDLTAIEVALSNRLANVRRAKDRAKRLRVETGEDVRSVTDHAIVRYLERHKGMDVEAIRDELRQIATEAEPSKDGEHYWHEARGVFIVLNTLGAIVTVLSREQAEKWVGRKLLNGERVVAASADAENS